MQIGEQPQMELSDRLSRVSSELCVSCFRATFLEVKELLIKKHVGTSAKLKDRCDLPQQSSNFEVKQL